MLNLIEDKKIEEKLGIKSDQVTVIETNSNKLRDQIKKNKGLIIIQAGDDKLNRDVLENNRVDILLSPEKNIKEDSIQYRKTGLNQVLCKIAKENNVAIGFDFSYLLNANSEEKAKILGRMIFNYKLCKKYGVKMIISSFAKNPYELRSNDCMKIFERILDKSSKEI